MRAYLLLCIMSFFVSTIVAQGINFDHYKLLTELPEFIDQFNAAGPVDLYSIKQVHCETVAASSTLSSSKNTYTAKNLIDGNSSTAWVEGEKDNGNGVQINFNFKEGYESIPDIIEILPGYAKSSNAWQSNNRLLEFKMELLGTEASDDIIEHFKVELSPDKSEPGSFFILIYNNHLQNMAVDRFHKLKITLLKTDAGEKYNDTCISEIKFYKKNELIKSTTPEKFYSQ